MKSLVCSRMHKQLPLNNGWISTRPSFVEADGYAIEDTGGFGKKM